MNFLSLSQPKVSRTIMSACTAAVYLQLSPKWSIIAEYNALIHLELSLERSITPACTALLYLQLSPK
jgi:hypothetical protein